MDQWQLCNGLSETTLHSHPVATVLHMVKRISDDGKSAWHEPPFTKEEEEDLYRVRLPDTNWRSDISTHFYTPTGWTGRR